VQVAGAEAVRGDQAGFRPDALDQPVEWEGWTIRLSTRAPSRDGALTVPAPEGALVVRSRRPGDRLAGRLRMKVQDLFTDAKVPARMRDAHPLVATEDGAVCWVVGLEHATPTEDGARWLGARPPAGATWSIADGARSIEPRAHLGKDERHELR